MRGLLVWCLRRSLKRSSDRKAGPSTPLDAQSPQRRRPVAGGPDNAPNSAQDDSIYCDKEKPQLCLGGSSSLTFPEFIPRFCLAIDQSQQLPAGAKAQVDCAAVSARLKSCPVTKPGPHNAAKPGSGERFGPFEAPPTIKPSARPADTYLTNFRNRTLSVFLGFAGIFCGTAQLMAQPVPPSTVMPPVRYVMVYGQRMAYYDLSNGPVLVLVHGFGTSAAIDWAQVIRPLSQHYRVIAIDNIGFGLSDKPNIAYNTQTFVDFIAEFLRELNITHFYLAGESMGGGISALYAAESAAPDSTLPKVDKLVLTDAALMSVKPPLAWPGPGKRPIGLAPSSVEEYRKGLAVGLFVNPAFATEAYARDVYQMLLSYHSGPTAEALMSGIDAARASDYLGDHLKDIRIPTLIVWGHDDKIIPLAVGDYLHQNIAGSKYVVVPECGHAPGMEKPGEYLDAVIPFLGQ